MSSARRRGLADVFHYFIPEEEQRKPPVRARGRASRWVLLADPDRPLERSLVLDLVSALRTEAAGLTVFAPFGPPAAWEPPPDTLWRVTPPPCAAETAADLEPIAQAIREADPAWALLAVVTPACAGALVRAAKGALDAVLVPVEAASWGIPEALARIRRLVSADGSLRIGVLLLGDERSRVDLGPLRQLEGAVRRQFRAAVEPLGAILRDRASYRALLADVPVLALDPEAPSSESLRALARRMLAAPPPPAPTAG